MERSPTPRDHKQMMGHSALAESHGTPAAGFIRCVSDALRLHFGASRHARKGRSAWQKILCAVWRSTSSRRRRRASPPLMSSKPTIFAALPASGSSSRTRDSISAAGAKSRAYHRSAFEGVSRPTCSGARGGTRMLRSLRIDTRPGGPPATLRTSRRRQMLTSAAVVLRALEK